MSGYEGPPENPRVELARVAEAMLNGSMPYLAGAIALVALRDEVGAYENDPDFLPFMAVSLEAEKLGISKPELSADLEAVSGGVLSSSIASEQESLQWAKDISLTQCESLLRRYRSS